MLQRHRIVDRIIQMKMRIVLASYCLLLAFSFAYVPYKYAHHMGERFIGYAWIWDREPFQNPFDPLQEYKREQYRQGKGGSSRDIFDRLIEEDREVGLRNPEVFRKELPKFKDWSDEKIRRAWKKYDDDPHYTGEEMSFHKLDGSRLLLEDLFLTAIFGAAFLLARSLRRPSKEVVNET